jgi:hypothetical protein
MLALAEVENQKKVGYIYTIKSLHSDKQYIGSTFKDLRKRHMQHISAPTKYSKLIIDAGESYIELVEEVLCDNRNDLNKREGYHILQNIDSCVNKCIAGRTLKESQKAYKEKHKEWYKEYIKAWRLQNPEKVKAYNKRN